MKITTAAAGLCLAALALTGCTGGGTGSPGADDAESPEVAAPPAGVCDVLSADDVGAAFDTSFEDGVPRTGEASANEVEWTTTGCGWEGDGMEVVASVAAADDFPAGFECVEPGSFDGEVTSLDGLGNLAWWTWDEFQGGTGTVIICGDDTRVEVEAEGPRDGPVIDEPTTREGATTLATRIFEAVG